MSGLGSRCGRSRPARDARDRDRGLAPARALLRELDDRLGEHHRADPRLSLDRLLARREARRPPSRAAPARADRARGRARDRGDAVHRAPDSRPGGAGPRRRLGRCRRGLVLRRACALRDPGDAARGGLALRDPARSHDVEQAGTVAGRLYALSTVGSIVGTFLSAIWSRSRSSGRSGRCSARRHCSCSQRRFSSGAAGSS